MDSNTNAVQAVSPPVLKLPTFSLEHILVAPEMLALVPAKWATRFKVFPVAYEHNILTLAASDVPSITQLQELDFYLKTTVILVRLDLKNIEELIRTHYGIGAQIVEELIEQSPIDVQVQNNFNDEEEFSEASVGMLVDRLIRQAYVDRATDIHLEPRESQLSVRYRIDGILHDANVPANIGHFKDAIVARIKILASLDIAERRLPHDGRFKFRINDKDVDCRVSVLPSPFGEAVVIRILNSLKPSQLDELGMLNEEKSAIERFLKKEHGIIFVTGPTGSGKTTTLYSCLSQLNTQERKIITLEDPIEYQLPGVLQTQVHPVIGLTFARGLRSMLRHDPDVMMIGEVRDEETARIAIQIALTGHLVFSTLHTNDAISGIARLLDMGIEPYLITGAVECFIAQRLVRILCVHCRRRSTVIVELQSSFPFLNDCDLGAIIFEAQGCERCRFTGYQGREAIYEILPMTDRLRDLIIKRSSLEDLRRTAVEGGMKLLRQSGWEKIRLGKTSCAEILRVTQEDVTS